jgi:class 3 adenylate cyclase
MPLLSMRSVVSAMSAALVVIVVTVTFTTTYFTGLAAIDAVGRSYALAVVGAARYQSESYFDFPARRMESIATVMKQPGFVLPVDDPTEYGVLNRTTELMMGFQLESRDRMQFANVIFDDGSRATTQMVAGGQVVARSMISAKFITNLTTQCCGRRAVIEHFVANMSRNIGDPFVADALLEDARVGLYQTIRALLFGARNGLWQPPAYTAFAQSGAAFELPAFYPLRNNSGHFLGVLVASYQIAEVGRFLEAVKPTAGSEVFALDTIGALMASTHSTPYVTTTVTTDRNARIDANCASTALVALPSETTFTIGCRAYARDFAYAPLRAVSSDSSLMRPADSIAARVATDSGNFYVAATPVTNRFNVFNVNILLLMPETDVVGDIYRARNMTLAIVCVVLVAAVVAAFVASHAVLSPLALVSRRMHLTSRLRDDGTTGAGVEKADLSLLSEIRELQVAYGAMSTAIKSFTRYVPKEVVKDLIASGQLCRIAMEPHRCAMLFSDIAGFTSMCERVPVGELSHLVSVYFDRMSAAVMNHDGVVDKFIGDAVMAVWGAPVAAGNESLKALMAALAMIRETQVNPVQRAFDEAGEQLRIRVGVSAGEVLAGNMGCDARMNYTVIGDDVNLAARLESLCRNFGVSVLASEAAYADARAFVTGRRLRRVAVVGKEEAVAVYEIVGLRHTPDPDSMAALKSQAKAAASVGFDSHSSIGDLVSTRTARARHEDRGSSRTVPEMLSALGALADPAIAVTAATDEACELFNVASAHLDARQAVAALAALEKAEAARNQATAHGATLADTGADHQVYKELRERCEQALGNPSTFDPVLNLITKAA